MNKIRRKRKQQPWVPDGVFLDTLDLDGNEVTVILPPGDSTIFSHIPDNYRAAFVANKAIEKMMSDIIIDSWDSI